MAKKGVEATEILEGIQKLTEEVLLLKERLHEKDVELDRSQAELSQKIKEQEQELIEQEKLIITQELELTKLRKDKELLETKERLIKELDDQLKSRLEYIKKLESSYQAAKQQRDEFRHSIVFPLFRLTHSFGMTPPGQVLQKILK